MFDSSPHSFPALVLGDFNSSILGQGEQNILCPPTVALTLCWEGTKDKPCLAFLSSSGSLVAGALFVGFGVQGGPFGVTQQHCQF